MALFGRRRDKDEDDDRDDYERDDDEELDLKEKLEERRLKRRLKDLKAENKKRRKEPTKPWGKKERMMILIILGVTILISAFLAISSRGIGGIELSGPNFSLKAPDFGSLNIFKEQTIEIRKK